ncbi:uncharacterized protein BXZ73DRAFT_96635 [Epithele typhae]|uniref:uncharacterized protein n=1 Tax=Epithele typhae TaxID=378194 RepID=UPI002007B07B|nr:uncharacterized protein BXZ73DRAFT_96635 [Epithele typhae]KAH9944138.1 hypothetical protein BXZ73DRAFT_96635 [Epithele typhae]
MFAKSAIFVLYCLAFALLVNAAAVENNKRADIGGIINSLTSDAGSIINEGTSLAGSIFTDATQIISGVGTFVTSVGGQAATIVTSVGGPAITVVASGEGVVTSFAGSVYNPSGLPTPLLSGFITVLASMVFGAYVAF